MIIWMVVLMLMNMLMLAGCENNKNPAQQSRSASSLEDNPAQYARGEALFNAKCAPCHGQAAKGTNHGPPLILKIYEPSHHANPSFHRAVRQGVQAHHWEFGNMPRIEGVSEEEVNEIITYVRWLQRQAGIF